jgi:ATP-dependent DNA ligase I
VLLADIAETSEAVRATSSRLAKVEAIASLLRRASPGETESVVAWLTGAVRQGPIGVGWASLRAAPPPAPEPSLTVGEVEAAFSRIALLAGAGSVAVRREEAGALFGRATAGEQDLLRGLLLGDLRQGALAGVMVEAVARAAEVKASEVRRAAMLQADLGLVARTAIDEGVEGLRRVGLVVGRPVQPMLASPAVDVADAFSRVSPAVVEWKLDGARIQVHVSGGDVAVFTRNLDDVTARVPEIVEAARSLSVREAILDGEAIALREDGRPHPFQVTGSRFATRGAHDVRLSPFFFDVLHVDGEDLVDSPTSARLQRLDEVVPEGLRVPRIVAEDEAAAAAFLEDALARGHEGVMVKALDVPYAAGRRGAAWLKVKPRHTLDLVVLAVEWGHGRRKGKLSNLHLGARSGDGFVMLGKTFKGLTDEMLAWQTERLLELATDRGDWVVHVRPELVVEIAFDGVQTSTRYPGGVALRFARVLRHRPDKPATEADTLDAVLAIRDH